MRKRNGYEGVWFSAETIQDASSVFEQQWRDTGCSRLGSQWDLVVQRGSATWHYDAEAEFFADYRQFPASANYGRMLYAEGEAGAYEGKLGTLTVMASAGGVTTVSVEARDRAMIEAVFEVFERAAPSSRLPLAPPRIDPQPIVISHRIITLSDLRRLAQVVLDERAKREPLGEDEWASVSFAVECGDGAKYEGREADLFAADAVPATKRVVAAAMSFSYSNRRKEEAAIQIHIQHGNSSVGNTIAVGGTDSTWVNGTIRKFEELVDSITPQSTFVLKHRRWLNLAFAIGMGAVVVRLLLKVVPTSPSPLSGFGALLLRLAETYQIFQWVIVYGVFWMFGSLPAALLMQKLFSLWPSVEFQIGPEHKLVEKRRKAWLVTAAGLGVLPIGEVVYDLARVFIAWLGH